MTSSLEYWATMSQSQHKALAIVSKISGGASFAMSFLVAITILRRKSLQTYHRLFLGIAVTDLVSSPIYIASTWSVPTHGILQASYRDEADALETLVWNIGNPASCKAQAFLAQCSSATCFYTASLLFYFLLVICKGWREPAIRKVEVYFHCIPIICGILPAILGLWLDIYGPVPPICYISKGKELYWVLFMFLPGWFFFAVTAVTNLRIVWHVRNREGQSRRFRFEEQTDIFQPDHSSTQSGAFRRQSSVRSSFNTNINNNNPASSRRTKEVALQCFYFGAASLVHFSGLLIQSIQWLTTGRLTFASALVTFITLPFFGLPSGVVYFRPKFLALRRKHPNLTLFQIIMQTLYPATKCEDHDDDVVEFDEDHLDDTESATEHQRPAVDNEEDSSPSSNS